MNRKKIFFVLNPVAGLGQPAEVHRAIDRWLSDHEVDLYETTGNEELGRLVRQRVESERHDWVVAAGGDGTVSLVADGTAESGVPLGIVPIGTANVLSRELSIPQDPGEACRLLAAGPNVRHMDALRVGDAYILLHLSLGLNTRLMNATSQADKNRLGVMAYFKNLVQELSTYAPQPMRLTVDGREHYLDASELMVANAAAVGVANFSWGDHIMPDDGRIDLCIVSLNMAQDYAAALWSILTGAPQDDSHIQYHVATESLKIETLDHPIQATGDGELLGETPIEAQVVRSAVPVLVP